MDDNSEFITGDILRSRNIGMTMRDLAGGEVTVAEIKAASGAALCWLMPGCGVMTGAGL